MPKRRSSGNDASSKPWRIVDRIPFDEKQDKKFVDFKDCAMLVGMPESLDPIKAFLEYLDKEMTIMGILSTFCAAAQRW